MRLKTALFHNFLASGTGKLSTVVFRLVQVPLLLTYLGVDEYGRWLILASLPSWLTLANIGFGSVAANEMVLNVASGNRAKAREVLSTAIVLTSLIVIVGSVLIFLVAPLVPWETLLNTSPARHAELVYAVIWLSLSVLVSFYGETFTGRFRSGRKAHISMYLASVHPWVDLAVMLIVLQFTKHFEYLSFGLLCSNTVYILTTMMLSKATSPDLAFSYSLSSKSNFKQFFRKGIAFQAFPLGNALLFQGNLLIIQALLGPTAVALFGTARTLVRSINQLMEMINQVIWPELSLLFGANKLPAAARLHRLGVGMSLIVSALLTLLIGLFGQEVYAWWTGQKIELSQELLMLFLLPIPFNALWYTSSVVHAACNQHEGLAKRYLLASVFSVICCILLTHVWGVNGAAVSTLFADLLLINYVLSRSLELTEDDFRNFAKGIPKEIKQGVRLVGDYFVKFSV